jgi:hypothetical protein
MTLSKYYKEELRKNTKIMIGDFAAEIRSGNLQVTKQK